LVTGAAPVVVVQVELTTVVVLEHETQSVAVAAVCPQRVQPTTAVPPVAVKQAVQTPETGVA